MAAVPVTNIICSSVADPCPPGSETPCPPSWAVIATDGPIAPPGPGVETVLDFDLDISEFGTTDADAINERIVIGEDAVYSVVYTALNGVGPAGGTITVRIRVDGISDPALTFVTSVGAAPTPVVEQANIQLFAGNALTVTVEPSFEGASILSASLAAVKICGPAEGVLVQG